MKTISVALAATLALACSPAAFAGTPDDQDLIKQGAYVAREGDCVACHTALHGRAFAGGLKIATPIGTIYSTNITPDPKTGIGGYTLEEFSRAIRKGVRKDGSTLYPAMPYPAFAHMTDEDIRALYAYFMHGVAPVDQADLATDIPWPLSMRWPLAVWRILFAPTPGPFTPSAGEDAVAARGEYLVTAPGHCGACHTPRGFAMQEKALKATDATYLSGGAPIDNWVAPSLRSDPVQGLGTWSEDDIALFLKTGRTDHAAVFGGMADVVAWSTQHLTDDDLHAIAHYLKTMPGVPAPRSYTYDPSTAKTLASTAPGGDSGAAIYVAQCAICHQDDGSGVARMFPPMAGNPVLQTANPASIINVVVHGGILPPTNWAPSAVAMPGYQKVLTPAQVAMVANFVRHSWGNSAPGDITESDIKRYASAVPMPSSIGWNTASNGWDILHPQPYGAGWTFSPETHTGIDSAQ